MNKALRGDFRNPSIREEYGKIMQSAIDEFCEEHEGFFPATDLEKKTDTPKVTVLLSSEEDLAYYGFGIQNEEMVVEPHSYLPKKGEMREKIEIFNSIICKNLGLEKVIYDTK